jgi:hypothetical protein
MRGCAMEEGSEGEEKQRCGRDERGKGIDLFLGKRFEIISYGTETVPDEFRVSALGG